MKEHMSILILFKVKTPKEKTDKSLDQFFRLFFSITTVKVGSDWMLLSREAVLYHFHHFGLCIYLSVYIWYMIVSNSSNFLHYITLGDRYHQIFRKKCKEART